MRRTADSKSADGGLIPSTPAKFDRALLRLRHIVYSGPAKGLFDRGFTIVEKRYRIYSTVKECYLNR